MKSAPKAPTPIDPAVTAAAQEKASIGTAQAQNAMNQVSSSNPFGSTNYQQTGTVNIDGNQVPTYSKSTQLSAPLSSLLGSIEGAANNANYGIDTSHLVGGGSSIQDPQLLAKNTSDAIYNQATSRLDPQWDQTQRRLEAQLSQQGLAPGSEAYGQAIDSFNRAKNDAYTSAQNSATESGVRDASQLYQDILAGRQQGVNEQTQSQTLPMSLLAQMMSGSTNSNGTQTPQVSVQTPDVLGAYQTKAQQQQNNYNAALNSYNSSMGGLGSLAGNALMFAML